MKIHRFIFPFGEHEDTFTLTDQDLVHQIVTVLKITAGEHIVLTNGAGDDAEFEVETTSKKEVVLKKVSEWKNKTELEKDITLYISLLKRDNFELVVEKVTELGVRAIVPLISSRTIKTGFNRERIEKIMKEAVEQCGGSIVPLLTDPLSFKEALTETGEDKKIIFDGTGEIIELSNKKSSESMALFVGPEGGWESGELEMAKESGFEILSFGPRTYRGETAAIVAVSLAHYL
jgi:16S rRNA (uracil1498-N3)-methyltransferase